MPSLIDRIFDGYTRAVRASRAADLSREFVDVVLPLLPEAAPEFLELVEGNELNEGWMSVTHAPVLWRHARERFIARLGKYRFPCTANSLFAKVAAQLPSEEVPALRTLARQHARESDRGFDRAAELLVWLPALSPVECAACIDEAFRITLEEEPTSIVRALRRFGECFDDAQRAQFRAAAERAEPRVAMDVFIELARFGTPDERAACARAAMERSASLPASPIHNVGYTAARLVAHVPFALLQSWIDPLIDSLEPEALTVENLRNGIHPSRVLIRCARDFAAHAPPATLDRIIARADVLRLDHWDRLSVLVPLSAVHPTRGASLLDEIRSILARVVMLPQGGIALAKEDVPFGADTLLLTLDAIEIALPALPPAERREFQRRAIALLVSLRSDARRQTLVSSFPWGKFAASLDPDLREPALRAVCAFEYRPLALKAVGEMAAAFPSEARHLALQGLARLADPVAPRAVAEAIESLRTAPIAAPGRAGVDRSNAPLDDADRVRLQMFSSVVSPGAELFRYNLRAVCEVLSAAAAEHVAASLDDYTASDAHDIACALVDLPALNGSRTRETLLSRVIDYSIASAYGVHDWSWIATRIAAVCGAENEAFWIERVAAILDTGHGEVEVEKWLARVSAFAPLLRRLGGSPLVDALVARLETPIPPPAFAAPWTLAAGMVIEA